MTEIKESVAVILHPADDESCPFCPGKEEKSWTTYPGEKNSSKILRIRMNNPDQVDVKNEVNIRPKDGKEGRQTPDGEETSPNPIFSHPDHGDYRNEAHHCISGNEIMKGHEIEQYIVKGNDYKGDTGYTINTGANGVYLPSYPKRYGGVWGSKSFPKTYTLADGTKRKIKNPVEDTLFKIEVMAPAMNSKGQAHIGGHAGFYDESTAEVKDDYPDVVKKILTDMARRVRNKSSECPFCVDTSGTPKKPFLPPFKVNRWLDNVSRDIARNLRGSPKTWPYYLSAIAKAHAAAEKREALPAEDAMDEFTS